MKSPDKLLQWMGMAIENRTLTQVPVLTEMLRSHGIPLDQWGVGEAKTIEHLVSELDEGEARLGVAEEKLVRYFQGIHIDVRFRSREGELQLVEDVQIFRDGRERRRGIAGLGEKIKTGETPLVAARRALTEELRITDRIRFDQLGIEEGAQFSKSYPGLLSQFRIHQMRARLPESAYNPRGYVEAQLDKITYFVWQLVPEA